MRNPELFYKRNNSIEQAIAIRLNENTQVLQTKDVTDVLDSIGLTSKDLLVLINTKTPLENPIEIRNSEGELVEEVYESSYNHPSLGLIEVSLCKLYPEVVHEPINAPIHEPEDRSSTYGGPGFEMFYVIKGEATMFIPDNTAWDPETDTFIRSAEGTHIVLQKGSLLIIPSPTPNGWSDVNEGFEFKYIGFPPYDVKAKEGRIIETSIR
jgi:hypothetical protein